MIRFALPAFLLLCALLLCAMPADAASFDCAKAKAPDEKTICATRALNDADVKMTTLLDVDAHLMAMGGRSDMQDAQRVWLRRRQACKGDVKCLTKAYADRLADLQAAFDGIASQGPF